MKLSTFPQFSQFLAAFTPKVIALGVIGAAMTAIGGSIEAPVAIAGVINTDDPDVYLRRGALGCQGCDLNDADLSDQERPRARLRQAQLEDADLSGSNFRVSHFTCANLEGADLSDGNFEYANFVDANLRGVDLSGANLRRVDFTGAIIDEDTDFDGADLDGAKLWDGATLYDSGVDLDEIERTTIGDETRVRCDNGR